MKMTLSFFFSSTASSLTPPVSPPLFFYFHSISLHHFLVPSLSLSSLLSSLILASTPTLIFIPLHPSAGLHLGRYCGETSPGQVIAYSGILSMTVTTDHAITKEGFSANYTIHERSLPSGPKYEGEQLNYSISLSVI